MPAALPHFVEMSGGACWLRPIPMYLSAGKVSSRPVALGVTESSWDQCQKASHWPLARRVLKASMGFNVSTFHQVPGNFSRD